MVRVFCFVSDKDLWTLRPFAWFFGKYWGEATPVVCFGYSPPEFALPPNMSFVSIGDFADYPVNKWSDGIIKGLESVTDDLFVWMMGDFWVYRKVDVRAIGLLAQYMQQNTRVSRIDLTTDRLYAGNLREMGSVAYLDLIMSDPPAAYHMSLQPGLWRRADLLKYLVPGETGWDTEIAGTTRMIADGAVVLGTRQCPVRALIAVQHGKLTLDGGYQVPPPPVKHSDLEFILESGWLPE